MFWASTPITATPRPACSGRRDRCRRRGGALPQGQALGRFAVPGDRAIASPRPGSRSRRLRISPSIPTRRRALRKKIGYALAAPARAEADSRPGAQSAASGCHWDARSPRHFPASASSGELHRIEHHLAHLASAFLVSPFDEAAAVSVDGFGDFSQRRLGRRPRRPRSTSRGASTFPHSLGVFYQAITQYLGFPHYGDEYKVMGLAPYGEPDALDEMRRIVRLCR